LHRPDPAVARRVAELAQAQSGVPYRYGGATPAGFDCSGLVRYVFRRAAGLTLPHSVRELFTSGRPVPRGAELPSDLIFYSMHGGNPTHVAIYLGEGRFVHASDTGDTVKVTRGDAGFWRSRYLGARRVLE
jgi:murein DD-endopeptidase